MCDVRCAMRHPLQAPKLFMSVSVPKRLKARMKKLARKMGAEWVMRKEATHLIEYVPDVDDPKTGPQPEYCRTIGVNDAAKLAHVRHCTRHTHVAPLRSSAYLPCCAPLVDFGGAPDVVCLCLAIQCPAVMRDFDRIAFTVVAGALVVLPRQL